MCDAQHTFADPVLTSMIINPSSMMQSAHASTVANVSVPDGIPFDTVRQGGWVMDGANEGQGMHRIYDFTGNLDRDNYAITYADFFPVITIYDVAPNESLSSSGGCSSSRRR